MRGGFRRRRSRAPSPFAELATTVQRLAVLLGAGLAPASAWHHVAGAARGPDPRGPEPGTVAASIGLVADRIARGEDAASALAGALDAAVDEHARAPWAALAAAWSVATTAGAPLAPTLTRFAEVLRALAQSEREIETALAGPTATARVIVVLPVVGVLFGIAMGFDVLGTLFTTIPGAVCLMVGAVLLACSLLWTRRLVGAARRLDPTPGLTLDLVAVAVGGGAALDTARRRVDQVAAACGVPPCGPEVSEVVEFARAAGAPAAVLLRAEAEEARRVAAADAAQRAGELGVRLMLPLGICLLPSFLAWGVVPMILALVTSTSKML